MLTMLSESTAFGAGAAASSRIAAVVEDEEKDLASRLGLNSLRDSFLDANRSLRLFSRAAARRVPPTRASSGAPAQALRAAARRVHGDRDGALFKRTASLPFLCLQQDCAPARRSRA